MRQSIRIDEVVAVLLAAGDSSRFRQGNKLLMPLAGRAVICRMLETLLKSSLINIFIVVGFESDRLIRALGSFVENPKLNVVFNNSWQAGKASSVSKAIENFPETTKGGLFLPADMPLMTSGLIDRVLTKFCETGKITFPVLDGQKGHPVAFPKVFWNDLQRLEGEQSAMELIKSHWAASEKIELTAAEALTQQDLDTQDDYERLKAVFINRSVA